MRLQVRYNLRAKEPKYLCMHAQDPKGLYKKAFAGEITNMTGIQDPYEEPSNPEVTLNTENDTSKQNIRKVSEKLRNLARMHIATERANEKKLEPRLIRHH